MALDLTATAQLPCRLARAHSELEVLDHYGSWLGIVHGVHPAEPDRAGADPGPAWWVDLGGRIGIITRTKRVRMVRSLVEPGHLRFERRELDGRSHNEWILDARLAEGVPDEVGVDPARPAEAEQTRGAAVDPVTFLTMSVRYSGNARVPLLDAVLAHEVRRAGRRLTNRVSRLG